MKLFTADRVLRALVPAAFWIGVWWLAAALIGRDVLVPTPLCVAQRLLALGGTAGFWRTVLESLLRISAGFLLGVVFGVLTGILTGKLSAAGAALSPLLTVIRATPVASFIILALVWMERDLIPVFISFLMVFPVLQSNVQTGVRSVSPELLEMERVFRVPLPRRIRTLYVPAVLPYFTAGCITSIGLSWKAGIAAEVIAVPTVAIGRELYLSKLYLETPDVFAWTVTVILLSLLIERLLGAALRRLSKRGASA